MQAAARRRLGSKMGISRQSGSFLASNIQRRDDRAAKIFRLNQPNPSRMSGQTLP